MISKPSTPQLIEAVERRAGLQGSPELGRRDDQGGAGHGPGRPPGRRDPQRQRAGLDAGGGATPSTRWRERLVDELPEATALAEAFGLHRQPHRQPLPGRRAQADYERVSEVLSCAAEAVYADGDPAASRPSRSCSSSAWPTRTPSSERSRPSAGRSVLASVRLAADDGRVAVGPEDRQRAVDDAPALGRAGQLVLVGAGHDEGVAARRALLDVLADEVAPACRRCRRRRAPAGWSRRAA